MDGYEYVIEDKVVGKKEFDEFLSTLQEIPGTWYCDEEQYDEETYGGETGYDAVDKDGVVYKYKVKVTESGKSINSIKRKKLL